MIKPEISYTDDAIGRAQQQLDESAPLETPVDAALKLLALARDAQSAAAPLRQLAEALKGADALRRAVVREQAVATLKGKASSPATLVDAVLGKPAAAENGKAGQGQAVDFADLQPWQEPVDGAELLDHLAAIVRRFVVLPDHGDTATALWTLHTYSMDATSITPRLLILSPEKRCGKSLLLDVLAELVRRALASSANISPAAVFRLVEAHRPTLTIDEADAIAEDAEDLRGLLNLGYRRGAKVPRVEGDAHEVRLFSVFAAVALARIGRPGGRWSTLEDRAIIVALRRKGRSEKVERWRSDRIEQFIPTRRRAVRWSEDHLEELRVADPEVPAELHDRAADNWRHLLAIADAAGGDWPKKARAAAKALSCGEDDGSAGVLLLSDLREMFHERQAARLTSAEIVETLAKREDRPWPEWQKGRPITQRQLARLLRPFEIKPKKIREGDPLQGYLLEHFEDPFLRYLPPNDPEQRNNSTGTGTFANFNPEQGPPVVPDRKTRNLNQDGLCSGVPDEKGGTRRGEGIPADDSQEEGLDL